MKLSRDKIFNDNTLNIFTDASIKKRSNGETIGCAGALAYIGDYFIDESLDLVRETTNSNSELKAIEKGVELALLYRNRVDTINLFSDSKISIYGLREWIFKWVNMSVGSDKLIKADGSPVMNQDIILKIIYMILWNDLSINLYHQNGHVSLKNDKSLLQAKETFINSNHLEDVDMNLIKDISQANYIVDMDTRYAVNNAYVSSSRKIIEPIKCFYLPFDVVKYSNLINTPLV